MVAREQEVLEREHGAVLQRQVDAAVALHRRQVLDDPVHVELAVVHAGVEGVALQVIHAVRVQLAADDLAQHRQEVEPAAAEDGCPGRRSAGDERRHVRGLDPASAHAPRDLGREARIEQQLERVVLVVRLPLLAAAPVALHPLRQAELGGERHDPLGRVRERRVAEIVEEHREPQRLTEAGRVGRLESEPRQKRVEHPRRHRHRAQPVRVAGVGRAGEGEVGEAELLDVAQPLVLRAVDERLLVGRDLDRAVDGIADVHPLHPWARASISATFSSLRLAYLSRG